MLHFDLRLAPLLLPTATLCLVQLTACGDSGGREDAGLDDEVGTLDSTSSSTDESGESSESAETTAGESTDTTTGGASCTSSSECAEGEYCVDGTCIEGEGECSTHDDCDGDTYCCDAPDCLPADEEPGVCIPFGAGPFGTSNPECEQEIVIGLFEPDVQCEWLEPPEGDPYPGHVNVLTTPLVADLPYDSGTSGEIVIVTYNYTDGGASAGWGQSASYYGVIRVLNGDDCSLIANIHDPENLAVAASPPAIADLDGDGDPEIVTQRAITGLVAYTWDEAQQTYVTMWTSEGQSNLSSVNRWDGPAIHDLDSDGMPEVISGSEVYDGATGARLNPGQVVGGAANMVLSVIGDLDHDFVPELLATDIYEWDMGTSTWIYKADGGPGGRHYAFADFGQPGLNPGEWDAENFDNIAEIVTVGENVVYLHTLDGELLLQAEGILGGGPPTIGDFDNDGRPEIASAGGNYYRVFDLDCDGGDPSCAGTWVRWIQASQDLSSRTTGSSIFDFEGDGKAEAIYGDECFVRVYEGESGEVLYSAARTSCTWYENPIVADPDKDDNTEILVGSNTNCNVACPTLDPIHKGIRCEDDEGCVSGVCDEGFCRCADASECAEGHACTAPLAGTPGDGSNVCRAEHPAGIAVTGVRVLRDRLDRWASSRTLWNQHAYSITNIEDDLSVPDSATWGLNQNFSDPELNNYRQNRQGDAPPEAMPDITGELDDATCSIMEGQTILEGTVCNRGLKAVGSALPAAFYLGDPADGVVLCVAYTEEPVPVDECREVSCNIDNEIEGLITMVTNDDGMGGKTTIECFENNNSDVVEVDACIPIG
ncbi:VCBS repeat-containing protein [Pseudenhygromyxa sp. WMMC2535]|uniref:FG-GAP repeat domain-containing protein n=1 Tax=Pseudenhygromyxa sp. WMMC2535 TaxID=2712867 RepID=UPI001551EFF4|nr:VCBS repeat-containing protein [Pseudenhygromyxa sp. WMMC2535]NVB36534.1 VCBS repeat-containing protein [Pseudenhygromyxa sp. WMMC2535]